MATGTFGTAINCMDGRAQTPVADWVKIQHNVQYVDAITEAGADGILARGPSATVESIRQRVLISVNNHGSCIIAVAGHHDCAGNPVSKEEHFAHIKSAMHVIAGWGLPVRIAGLWVNDLGYVEVVATM